MTDTGAWGTTSGLLDDYDHIWEEVWFGYNDKYQEGKVLLLHVQGPAEQEGEVVEEELLNMYSCGDGWEVGKGGEEAVHKNGNVKFSNSSNVGKLVDRVMELLADDLDELAAKGNPNEARTWRGMVVHIERQGFSYRDRKTGETREYEVPLPTEIIEIGEPEEPRAKGRGRGKGSAAPSTRGKAAASTSRTRTTRAKAEPEEVDDDDTDEDEVEEAPAPKPRSSRAKATTPAKKSPTSSGRGKTKAKSLRDEVIEFASEFKVDNHGSFLDAVYDTDEFARAEEIDEDADLSDEILDPDSELWAEAHA